MMNLIKLSQLLAICGAHLKLPIGDQRAGLRLLGSGGSGIPPLPEISHLHADEPARSIRAQGLNNLHTNYKSRVQPDASDHARTVE
jgi:hypothetical protein